MATAHNVNEGLQEGVGSDDLFIFTFPTRTSGRSILGQITLRSTIDTNLCSIEFQRS